MITQGTTSKATPQKNLMEETHDAEEEDLVFVLSPAGTSNPLSSSSSLEDHTTPQQPRPISPAVVPDSEREPRQETPPVTIHDLREAEFCFQSDEQDACSSHSSGDVGTTVFDDEEEEEKKTEAPTTLPQAHTALTWTPQWAFKAMACLLVFLLVMVNVKLSRDLTHCKAIVSQMEHHLAEERNVVMQHNQIHVAEHARYVEALRAKFLLEEEENRRTRESSTSLSYSNFDWWSMKQRMEETVELTVAKVKKKLIQQYNL